MVIVLVTMIITARMKPLLLLLFLPKIRARVRQKLRRIAPQELEKKN
jgi:hypothetical protein